MMRLGALGAVLAGAAACFAPEPQVGLPCGPGETCPAGQECRANVCELPIGAIDAPIDPADAPDGAGPPIDARPDARVDCWDQWLGGTPTFGPVRELTELSTATYEGDPYLTPDGLTIYFSRTNGLTARDFFIASRPSRAAPFGPASVVTELSGPADDTRMSLTADGLVAALSRRSAAGDFELYEATRAAAGDEFGTPTTVAYANLNDPADNQYDPWLTPDGLRLYYAPSLPGPSTGQALRFAARATLAQPFQPSVALAGITPTIAVDPTLSPDERVMVYAGAAAMGDPNDLYLARRDSPTDPFTGIAPLAALNTAGIDGDPTFTADGCVLVFGSDRDGPDRDIYTVDVVVPAP